jgi:hypothetical protein
MKNGGGQFTPELGGHFELESGGHFKLELGGQYHWNLHLNNGKTNIHLSEEQWNKFNPTFEKYLHQISTFVSDDAQSIVKRLGLILYRFCMIFTAIRKYQAQEYATDIQCADEDFETALTLIEIYLQHSIIMFNNLPKQEENGPFKSGDNKKQFFNALPTEFKRSEAIELGKTFKLAERTVGNLLKACIGKYVIQPEYGVYEKLNF